jgi:formamidopyrimidine-DNA glycosylase
MPELPEVETIKNDLEPLLRGRTFTEVTVGDETSVQRPLVDEFRRGLLGRLVNGLARRGKFLIISLDDGRVLIIHLRMTGNLLATEAGRPLPKELSTARVRVVFRFDDGSILSFIDRRRMGRMWLVADRDEVVGKLGPEPLDSGFSVVALSELLRRHRAPIKAVLCDQGIIAGIGNMYADEALYEARIHPLTLASELSRPQVRRLHGAIRNILAAAIMNKGASVDTYFRPGGERGVAHYQFKVAHRKDEVCPVCGGPVERIRVRGRGTYFCPKCQKARASTAHNRSN